MYTSIYSNISRKLDRAVQLAYFYLYTLVAETLAEAVREESEVKGIKLPDRLVDYIFWWGKRDIIRL